jgi:glycosyltransferase involved in cell wall biosynthesis
VNSTLTTGGARRGLPKICIVTSYDVLGRRRGGASITVLYLARHFARRYAMTIVSFSDPCASHQRTESIADSIRMVVLPHSPTSITARLALLREPAVRNSDLVIESADVGGPWFLFSAKRRILLAHQLWQEVFEEEVRPPLGTFLRLIEPWFYRPYRQIPTVMGSASRSARDSMIAVGIQSVLSIPFGSFERTVEGPPPIRGRELLAAPIITVLGRLRRYKGVQIVLEAMPSILHRFPDLRLAIAGDGPYRVELEGQACGLGIGESVMFLGHVSAEQRQEILRRSYACIAPSVREGYGFNVLDAYRAGTTVVGFDVPGTRDAIADGVTGVLARPRSALALADAIKSLLADPERRDSLTMTAHQFEHSIDLENATRPLDELVELLLTRSE